MKRAILVVWLALGALLVIPVIGSRSSVSADSGPYEVWVINHAGAPQGGGQLHIYKGEQLTGDTFTGTPEVIDLQAAAAGVGDGPGVRPHLLTFNSTFSHALIANVASGHVYFMRTSDRKIVASIDVGDQAHGALAAPDDSMVLVANQNGKRLARIMTDFSRESFVYNPGDDLKLFAMEDGGHPDNAPICPMMFVGNTKKAYVTLRGGGLYVVNAASMPMLVTASYPNTQVAPAGCGGWQVGGKMYVNSGTANSSDLYVFDSNDNLKKHIPFTPLGKDAHGMAQVGKYLWMANRPTGNIVVVDTETDQHVNTIPNVGAALDLMDVSPDGSRVFVALRGPNNLTGGPPAKGQTPGFAVLRVEDGGRSGTRSLFVPIGDQSPTSTSDPHAVAVRRGVSATATPTGLPRTGDGGLLTNSSGSLMGWAALVGALMSLARAAWARRLAK